MEITVTPAQAGLSVQTLLRRDYHFSSSQLSRLRRVERGLLCNGLPVFTTAILRQGDRLTVDTGREPPAAAPIPMALDIRWEDELLLIVNKPAGIAVHPSALTNEAQTLANALAAYLPACGFHPVNRLDRGTSGLMVVAKSGYAHALCQRLLHTEDFSRFYLGVCEGMPAPASGCIDAPIARDTSSLLRRHVAPDGSPARSEYAVLDAVPRAALLMLHPLNGRTHQLRVHLASIGHPLIGDWLYGTEDHTLIARPALHAWKLQLRHPLTGETLCVSAPPPQDFTDLLKKEDLHEDRIETGV